MTTAPNQQSISLMKWDIIVLRVFFFNTFFFYRRKGSSRSPLNRFFLFLLLFPSLYLSFASFFFFLFFLPSFFLYHSLLSLRDDMPIYIHLNVFLKLFTSNNKYRIKYPSVFRLSLTLSPKLFAVFTYYTRFLCIQYIYKSPATSGCWNFLSRFFSQAFAKEKKEKGGKKIREKKRTDQQTNERTNKRKEKKIFDSWLSYMYVNIWIIAIQWNAFGIISINVLVNALENIYAHYWRQAFDEYNFTSSYHFFRLDKCESRV